MLKKWNQCWKEWFIIRRWLILGPFAYVQKVFGETLSTFVKLWTDRVVQLVTMESGVWGRGRGSELLTGHHVRVVMSQLVKLVLSKPLLSVVHSRGAMSWSGNILLKMIFETHHNTTHYNTFQTFSFWKTLLPPPSPCNSCHHPLSSFAARGTYYMKIKCLSYVLLSKRTNLSIILESYSLLIHYGIH